MTAGKVKAKGQLRWGSARGKPAPEALGRFSEGSQKFSEGSRSSRKSCQMGCHPRQTRTRVTAHFLLWVCHRRAAALAEVDHDVDGAPPTALCLRATDAATLHPCQVAIK